MSARRLALVLLSASAALAAELRVGRIALDEHGVKALVLDDGETRAAIAMCDLTAVDEATVQAVRKQLAGTIPEGNVMIAATGVRTSRGVAPPAKIAEAVRRALASAQPASAWAGSGKEEATGFYNRFLMKDGNIRANPGRMNPDIVQPAGEADPDLIVARLDSVAGQPLALFGSFSLRADALDYPAAIAHTLGKLYGPEMVILWSTGSGANVSHIDVRSSVPQNSGTAEARRVGMILAGEAIKACARATRIGAPKLGVAREVVKLGGQPVIQAEVQVIALGGTLAWVGLPGELWTELGSAVRKASPFPATLLVGMANGSVGVLPTRKGYAAGDLETGVRASAGAGETVADAAVRLLAVARRLAARQ
jgi:hypothetical protein